MSLIPRFPLARAVAVIRDGGLLAYPTEAVYGLGCDPLDADAVLRILALKRRPIGKGVILIAAGFDQLAAFLEPLTPALRARIGDSWPGPNTWLLPCRRDVPRWLRGDHDTLAVRVTAHPLVVRLCRAAGSALVSTSANRAGQPPARTPLAVRARLGDDVDLVLHGALGGQARPTTIRDARSGELVRAG
ncbi:L-threonylcarbamoyladenylate synthase [Plasticicumulans acidivorans]|uniref:Threonylcarbamoyl-AMP synthase n=1 Tax=Plasticicumulans acidivorans TaxID=886464 RepID=A0A317N385_9GAMM|nr:Sua5/YciO/YrdC/YwlC family protein [Plasticicumulans acidivorans]PWV64597.1 translation factor SUA5 [Plasticicumulans acidivorans]